MNLVPAAVEKNSKNAVWVNGEPMAKDSDGKAI